MSSLEQLNLSSLSLAALLLAATAPALADMSYTEAEKLRAEGAILPTAQIAEQHADERKARCPVEQ